ncbi:MAG TPA: hypothetical protein EYH47_17950 [Pseudomonas oleovorans]|nr:hypothetical protein [Pseudomonas oleovorans]
MKTIALLSGSGFLLVGCSWFNDSNIYDGYAVDPVSTESIKYYRSFRAELSSAGLVPGECFKNPIPAAQRDNCTLARNSTASAIVLASESICLTHRKKIYGNEAAFNITAGTFTNLFAGAATAATAQTGKTILSSLALFSNAERSLVNESVYKQALVYAIDKKIVESRESKANSIYTKLESQNIDQYSIDRTLVDVYSFHNSCSFMEGLRLALQEGTQENGAHKLERLKNNLTQLGREVDVQCDDDPNAIVCKETENRFKSLSDTIKTLEAQ